jgi:hypothetical protein
MGDATVGIEQTERRPVGIPMATSRDLRFLYEQPYWNGSFEALAKEVGAHKVIQGPVAIQPPMMFPRMAVQGSTFTIHPSPGDGIATIPELLQEPKYLVRYVIPSHAKKKLLADLRALGVSRGHLFPDLEGLSQMINFDNRIVGYAAPDPPICSGEIPDS